MTDYTKLVEALRCGEYKPECAERLCANYPEKPDSSEYPNS